MKPILRVDEVDRWVAEQRRMRRTIGYTCGAFDILHAGHVDYLFQARQLCDRLIVAVNSDRSVQSYKSVLRPLNPERERQQVIAALECVDAVTLLDAERPIHQLERWRPDLYVKGGDYRASGLRSAEAVEAYGGKVVVISVRVGTSTSAIIERAAALAVHAEPEKVGLARPERIIFLDRDGTIIRDTGFLHSPDFVELLPGAGEGLIRLQDLGFRLVIITNQQGIGLGYYTTRDFIAVNQAMLRLLAKYGVRISKIYHCPHSVADGCSCRKPEVLLFQRALEHYKVAASDCYVLGDSRSDIEAGHRLGSTTVYLGGNSDAVPSYRAASFLEAVGWIESRESNLPRDGEGRSEAAANR